MAGSREAGRSLGRRPTSLMAELTLAGEDHCGVGFVGGLDAFLSAHRAARLNHGAHTGLGGLLDAVSKWEERVGAHHGAFGVVADQTRLVHREERRVDPRHLSRANSNRRAFTAQDDCVRFHAADGAPGEAQIPPLALRGMALGNDAPFGCAAVARGPLLRQKSAAHALVVEGVLTPARAT